MSKDKPDPFKEMVLQYDARIVAKGGESIFVCRPGAGEFRREYHFRRWIRREVPHIHPDTPGRVPSGRPEHIQKPGRIVATTLGIIGHANGDEEDFR